MNWGEFAVIALAHLFAVASPGPDFAVVLRQTLSHGTRAGIWTSAGIASGIGLHVTYCLLGVALVIVNTPSLFSLLKLCAAAMLLVLGAQSLRAGLHALLSRKGDHQVETSGRAASPADWSVKGVYVTGFLTNGFNPKATLFFLALFSAVISPQTSFFAQTLYGAYLAIATFLWFALLSCLIGKEGVRRLVLRVAPWVDTGMGVLLCGLALQLFISEIV